MIHGAMLFITLLALALPAARAGDWQVTRLKVAGVASDSAPVEVRTPAAAAPQPRQLRVQDTLPDGSALTARVDVEIELLGPGRMSALKEAGDAGTLVLVSSGAGGDTVEVTKGAWRFKRLVGAMARALDPFTVFAGSGKASTSGTEFTVAVDHAAGMARFAVQQGNIQLWQQGQVRIGDGVNERASLRVSARRTLAQGEPAVSVPLTPSGWLMRYPSYDDALAAFQAQLQDAETRRDAPATVDALIALGDMLVLAGRAAEALPSFERALPMVDAPEDAYWKAVLLGRRGAALHSLNRFADAARAFRDSLAVHELLPRRAGEWTAEEQSTNIALNLLVDGTVRCADTWAGRLLQRLDDVGAGPARHIRAPLLGIRGSAAFWQNGFSAARTWHTQALDLQRTADMAKRDRAGRVASPELAQAMNALGSDEAALGHLAAAEGLHRSALAMADGLFTAPHPLKADARLGLAEVQRARKRPAASLDEVRQALAVLDAIPPDAVRRGDAWLLRAEVLREGGRNADAVAAYREARTLLSGVWPDSSHPRFQALLPGLARTLRASGAPEADAQEAEAAARAGSRALSLREEACPR